MDFFESDTAAHPQVASEGAFYSVYYGTTAQ